MSDRLSKERARVGLPPRPFLYTLDQIAGLLGTTTTWVRDNTFFVDKTIGARRPHDLVARNIAPPGKRPDWRVGEGELLRWMKRRRFQIYDRGWVG